MTIIVRHPNDPECQYITQEANESGPGDRVLGRQISAAHVRGKGFGGEELVFLFYSSAVIASGPPLVNA